MAGVPDSVRFGGIHFLGKQERFDEKMMLVVKSS